MQLKNFGSNLNFYCFEYLIQRSLDYVLSENFDGTFLYDNNPKYEAVLGKGGKGITRGFDNIRN